MDPIHPIAPVTSPRVTPVPPTPRVGRPAPEGRRNAPQEQDAAPRRRRRAQQGGDQDAPPRSDAVNWPGGDDEDEGPDVRPHIDITV